LECVFQQCWWQLVSDCVVRGKSKAFVFIHGCCFGAKSSSDWVLHMRAWMAWQRCARRDGSAASAA
jgi:hypothetical protein